MNSQNEDENDMDSDFVKDKYKTRPSEATEETKKGKNESQRIRTNISISRTFYKITTLFQSRYWMHRG